MRDYTRPLGERALHCDVTFVGYGHTNVTDTAVQQSCNGGLKSHPSKQYYALTINSELIKK
jgi:hypothetical protein